SNLKACRLTPMGTSSKSAGPPIPSPSLIAERPPLQLDIRGCRGRLVLPLSAVRGRPVAGCIGGVGGEDIEDVSPSASISELLLAFLVFVFLASAQWWTFANFSVPFFGGT